MSTIIELRENVIAMNKSLKDSVDTMDVVTLLRNVHPTYRSDYAYRLLRENTISKEQASEFTKVL